MASITLENVGKVYEIKKDKFEAVKDFNLEIEDKEFIVLVGPSGCGKSTTLRMIAGLEEITEGEIKIGENVVNNVSPKDRDIAMVFQNYALYPHMNVYQNMAFGLTLRKMKKNEIENLVNEAAQILDIKHLLNRKPKELSGGQRQRVALGRAIVRHPKVFLFDEPLSNLDAKLRTQMRTEISKLHQKVGTTFVYVTHDQTEAMTMADKIVVMKDGVIQQVGTPAELYNKPCKKFVAAFIGSPQMNFFEGTLTQIDDDFIVHIQSEELHLPRLKNKDGKLNSYIGKKILIGVRPEDISMTKNKNKMNTYEVKIDLAELMGNEILAYFYFENSKVISRISSSTPIKTGDRVSVSIDVNKAHIFDLDTKETIIN